MSKFQIINFNQQTNQERENNTMNTSVIALPAGLDKLMEQLVIVKPNSGVAKTPSGIRLPAGPKTSPKGKHARGTRYTEDFVITVVNFIYDENLNLHQIADILNHYGKKSAFGKPFTKNVLHNALNTDLGWKHVEPRWIQWQLDNVSLFSRQD
jgi:hypothetical protein